MPVPDRDDVPKRAGNLRGRYKAIVKKVDDPDKLGRVRCLCPAVMDVDDDEDHWLDWAPVSLSYARGEGSADYGAAFVPEVGTAVWIEFENGDIDFPVVVGCWARGETSDESTLPKLGKGQADSDTDGQDRSQSGITVPKSTAGTPTYPNNRIIKTKTGHLIELDETDGNKRIRIRHASGSFMEYTDPGKLVMQVIADLLLWAGGKIKIAAVSDFILGTGGSLLLGSANADKRVVYGDDLTTKLNNEIITPFNSHIHSAGSYTKPAGTTVAPITGSSGTPTATMNSLSQSDYSSSKVLIDKS